MNESFIRVLVYPGDSKKPIFERIIALHDGGVVVDFNVIVKAMRYLFGKSSTINFECHGTR